jgi:hypothetical protein
VIDALNSDTALAASQPPSGDAPTGEVIEWNHTLAGLRESVDAALFDVEVGHSHPGCRATFRKAAMSAFDAAMEGTNADWP